MLDLIFKQLKIEITHFLRIIKIFLCIIHSEILRHQVFDKFTNFGRKRLYLKFAFKWFLSQNANLKHSRNFGLNILINQAIFWPIFLMVFKSFCKFLWCIIYTNLSFFQYLSNIFQKAWNQNLIISNFKKKNCLPLSSTPNIYFWYLTIHICFCMSFNCNSNLVE